MRSWLLPMLLAVALACSRHPREDRAAEPPPYTPATADHGRVLRCWMHADGRELKATPGYQLVAAELELPPPEGGKFDLDDIDIVDADAGANYGSDPHYQRLAPTGEPVDDDDPAVKDRLDYRGIFVWMVPNRVKRVNFGYWGEMLYRRPVEVQASGPQVLEPHLTATGLEAAGAAPTQGYDRYLATLRATEWVRSRTPRSYTLFASQAPEDHRICDTEAWIPLAAGGEPSATAVEARPFLAPTREFLAEYWCPQGSRPDALNLLGEHEPLPPPGSLPVTARARAALAAASRDPHAQHRLRED